MGDADELSELDVALYRAALTRPSATAEDLARALDRALGEVQKALARLAELGLLGTDDRTGGPHRFTAVSPMLAEATALGIEDPDLSARRLSVVARRNAIRRLAPDWNAALTARTLDTDVEVIHDQQRIGDVLMHYADRCRAEVLSVAPGRLPKARIDNRTHLANIYTLRRGAHLRALYQHTALNDRHTRSSLTELADHGAKIRFAPSLPGRSLVVDGEVSLLPIPTGDPGRYGLAVVREPNVVAWVIATFEQLWAEAVPLDAALSRAAHETDIDRTRAAILRLMAEGEKDETISRRLSMSVRTCRRQIADYMAQVGATSRFQAGVIAARAGHLDSG